MRLSAPAIVSALLMGAASVTAASHNARHSRRHHDLSAREPNPEPVEEQATNATNGTDIGLGKRGGDARFTFYDVGVGACGDTNSPGDFIVALNSAQYGSGYPGPQCFKMITITYGGKTTSAQITDECPGCPYRGLDMSRGLFTYFAPESEGVIYGDWWFSDGGSNGGGDDTTTSTSSKWTPTSSKWTPTSTWTPPTSTSSKWTPTTTWSSTSSSETSTWSSSSSWSSSSISTSSSTNSSSSSATSTSSYELSSDGLAVATGSGQLSLPTGTASENIYAMNVALIDMGALINAGAQLN